MVLACHSFCSPVYQSQSISTRSSLVRSASAAHPFLRRPRCSNVPLPLKNISRPLHNSSHIHLTPTRIARETGHESYRSLSAAVVFYSFQFYKCKVGRLKRGKRSAVSELSADSGTGACSSCGSSARCRVGECMRSFSCQTSKAADVSPATRLGGAALAFAMMLHIYLGGSAWAYNPDRPSPSSISDIALSTALPGDFTPVLDVANIISEPREVQLVSRLNSFAEETGWRILVLTRIGPGTPPTADDLRSYWQPDDRTIIVIEDSTSPNILNFNVGVGVYSQLPRQFFLELQSRYGNQFFVREEGDTEALTQTVNALLQCLAQPGGCNNVPGLTDELYVITLVLALIGGSVFGYAARLPPQGRVDASWQWVLVFSPLWLILGVVFGVLPIISRTEDVVPILKNLLAFLGAAAAVYLTPILGQPPRVGGTGGDQNEDV